MFNKEYKDKPFIPETQTVNGEFKTKEDLKHAKIRSKKHNSALRKLIMKIPVMFKNEEYNRFFDSFESIMGTMVKEGLLTESDKTELMQQAIHKMNIPGNMGLKSREFIEGMKEKAKTKPKEAWENIRHKFKGGR